MKHNIQFPDYERSILSISASIMKYYHVKSNYKSLPELDAILNKGYRNIVFLILDGMGDYIIKKHLSDDTILKSHQITTVTSVFPSTTAAATTAFHSGLSPLESGWIGWMPYFKEFNRAIVLFHGTDYYTDELIIKGDELKDLEYETIYQKICKKNKKVNYHRCFPSFVPNGANTFDELCKNIKLSCQSAGPNLVSAYWGRPDGSIHRYGTNSKEVKEDLYMMDNRLKKLSQELTDTLIIVSADHGAIDLKEDYINNIKELNDCLAFPPTVECRFTNFFIKKGMKKKFKDALNKYYKGKYILYTKKAFLKTGLLGKGTPHKRIDEYLGDYIVIMISDKSIRYTMTGEINDPHVGDHSGLTKDEMIVPVIAIECNGKKVKNDKFRN